MKCPVLFSVIKLFFNPITYFKTVVICHSNISAVEKPMDVRAEEEAIAYGMGTFFFERLNVSRFKRRQDFLLGDGASSLIGVCDHDTKTTLPQSGHNDSGATITTFRFGHPILFLR